MNFIPVKIEKVLELSGVYDPVFDCSHSIYAHVSEPIWEATKEIQYTL